MRFKIALRNIFRNRARTALSVLMIAGAVAGIIVFAGFANHVLILIRDSVINNQYGHIQVATHANWEMTPGDRKDKLIMNTAPLAEKLARIPGVTMVSGRLSFYGLISTGETTVSAKGIGFDPKKEVKLREGLHIVDGTGFTSDSKREVLVGSGLKKQLSLSVGQSVTALTYTLDGVVNAMDLTVKGVFRSGITEVDNSVFMLPLEDVQTLMDTQGVENLTLRIQNTEDTDLIRAKVKDVVSAFNPQYEEKSWQDLALLYRQVKSFYVVQNKVIEFILISLVLLGIMNTVGMSVFERTGEIGTIRALGETRTSVIFQFTVEGALLGLIGVVCGWVLGAVLAEVISSLDILMELPNSSAPILVRIKPEPVAYFEASVIGFFASVAATWIPAVRASRILIVDALRKNI